MRFSILSGISALILLVSCGPDPLPPPGPRGQMQIDFNHVVEGDSLVFGQKYHNAAGNEYSVSKLKYFVSGLRLYAGGERAFAKNYPVVINGRYADEQQWVIDDIPAGRYDSLQFILGIVPEHNITNGLDLEPHNMEMFWPVDMGGGYHFMKFEGHWQHGSDFGGYAFHLGLNENHVRHHYRHSFHIEEAQPLHLLAIMDMNRWFDTPHHYDLRVEGGYTMGDSRQMKMLVENGSNAISLKIKE